MSFRHYEDVPKDCMSITGSLVRATDKALLILIDTLSAGGENPKVHDISLDERQFWVPKSQVPEHEIDAEGNIVLILKTWLLEKNNIFIED